VGPLLNKTGYLVTQVEIPNVTFASVFTNKTSLQELQVPQARGKGWNTEDVPLVEEDQVREYLSKLDILVISP